MTPLFGSLLGPQEILILLIIGVLFFGAQLPEVGRYLGKGIVEFKKGMAGLEDEIGGITSPPRHEAPAALEPPRPPQRVTVTAPKFEDQATNITTPPQPQ